MPKYLNVTSRVRVPLDELNFTFARSGGPGGQNVNKVNTKAVMHWDISQNDSLPDDVRERFVKHYKNRITNEGHLVISSQRTREQQKNIDDCLDRLRRMLSHAARRPKPRKKTKPSRAARERRLQKKRETGEKKKRRRPPRLE